MSISRQNLSIVIVTFKSEMVVHKCIKSIDKDIKIFVIENSNNSKFKEELERIYKNVTCVLSSENLGMGAGNNIGIKKAKTDFVLILNPDVILETATIEELILASKKILDFGILAPISADANLPNYILGNYENVDIKKDSFFKVKSVDGYAMLINLKRLNQIDDFYYFDKNFFMYLENDDLCKRLNKKNENIYIIPKSQIKHLGGQAVNDLYKTEIELSRNWHWIWSKFYFNKKHYGFLIALLSGFPTFLSAILKSMFYSFTNKKKKDIYYHRALGYFNALLGRKSNFRVKINN